MQAPHDLQRLAVIRHVHSRHWLSEPHRIIDIDPDADVAYLFRMARPWVAPRVASWSELQELSRDGTLRLSEFVLPGQLLLKDEDLPPHYILHRDRWWSVLSELVDGPRRFLLYEEKGPLVADVALRRNVPKGTIYQKIYRYFYYGLIPNAFLPRFDQRGGPGIQRVANNGVAKRGRPRDSVALGYDEQQLGVNVTKEDLENFRWALKTFYVQSEYKDFAAVYRTMCRLRYSDRTEAGLIVPVSDRPTLGQFKYHAKHFSDLHEILKKRIGNKKWNKDYRAVIGRSSAEVLGPTDQFEIDATVGDVYLVSSYNRNWIIGRPVIYVVLDKFTNYFVGVYVGLEGPSWEGARLALLNAFSDKTEFLRHYDITPRVPWDAHHISVSVVADRAELLSKNAGGLKTGLGIATDICANSRADWKGLVEQKFNFLNNTVIHFVPGAVLKRIRERGGRDYALDGTLTLYEFTQIIIRAILHWNEHHVMRDRLTPAMIRKGINATPGDLWRYGLSELTGGTPTRTSDELYAHLLPQAKATVREDGIHFGHLRYSSRYALDRHWFEIARNRGRFSVDIRFNPEIPGRIWVQSEPESGIRVHAHEATLLDPFERYAGVRWEEAEDMIAFEQLKAGDAKESAFASHVNMDAENDQTVQDAREEMEMQRQPRSVSGAKKAIRTHRADERAAQRAAQAKHESETYGSAAQHVIEASKPADTRKRSATGLESMICSVLNETRPTK